MKTVNRGTIYETTDGREFQNQELAERHEELMAACAEYNATRRQLVDLLAKRCKTADGQLFEPGMFIEYYAIVGGLLDAMPHILILEFWGDNWGLRELNVEHDTVVLCQYKNNSGDFTGSLREFRISELYRSKKVAEAALKDRQVQWLRKRLNEVENG